MQIPRLAPFLMLATALACTDTLDPAGGVARITLAVSGLDPDTDGYEVTVDGGSATVITGPGSVTLELSYGEHVLALGGLGANCTPEGPDAQSVTIGWSDTTEVGFAVVCTAVTGVIEVTAPTTGHDPDPDGYGVSLDGGPVQVLMPNGVIRFSLVSGGVHSLDISGAAANCEVAPPDPREVSVSIGGLLRDTASVVIEVNCAATTGTLRITAAATGSSLDPDFEVAVDDGTPAPLASGVTLLVDHVPAGDHSIELADIASNCSVDGQNPVTVAVEVGDTTDVVFVVECVSPPRTGVDVILTTTGTSPDGGYYLGICGSLSYYCYYQWTWEGAVPANGTVELELPADSYTYYLGDVAANCAGLVYGSFDIADGEVTDLPLDLVCEAPASVRVTIATTGADAPSEYTVSVGGSWAVVPATGSVTLAVHSGTHAVVLYDVPFNCTVAEANPTTVDVTAGTTADVTFHVTCTQPGSVEVSAPTSGLDPDAQYSVFIDGVYRSELHAGGNTPALPVPDGSHSVLLADVASNCTVAGSNPVSVNVASGAISYVVFSVTCVAKPILRVTVTTTGSNAPATYLVGVDPDYYGYTYSATIPSNGTVSISMFAGDHFVVLDLVPVNCTVTSPNNVSVNVPPGATTDVAFTVTCS